MAAGRRWRPGFGWAPKGWALCNGQLLAINSDTALFSLIGTTYGGDGRTTFGLPDLRGRAPIHHGSGPGLTPREIGQVGGVEAVTLNLPQLATHVHGVQGSATSTSKSPSGAVPGFTSAASSYGAPDGTEMSTAMIEQAGGSLPHGNMQPYLALSYCIALVGIYPSRP